MDDMLLKSKEAKTHLEDLQKMFDTLSRYRIKVNPTKCVFGVSSRNSLVSWSFSEKLRQIQRRSKPYLIWLLPGQSRRCKG